MERKSYLGDGVYAEYDGYGIVLTVEDGVSVQHRIVLEPDVYTALVLWATSLKALPARAKL
jgi:hypothetical protein